MLDIEFDGLCLKAYVTAIPERTPTKTCQKKIIYQKKIDTLIIVWQDRA